MQKSKNQPVGPASDMLPPFAATCRAEAVPDDRQHSRCLVDANIVCAYRTSPFNFGPFCLHPRHLEIVARTAVKLSEANQPVAAAVMAGALD